MLWDDTRATAGRHRITKGSVHAVLRIVGSNPRSSNPECSRTCSGGTRGNLRLPSRSKTRLLMLQSSIAFLKANNPPD
jgi:hypothetical protein